MAQHQLNLLHAATVTLKAALKNKATKAAARAELAAVKATRKRQMDEEVRRAEEAMGPQAPVDPSLRQEYTGTYVEYIARLQKEEEEREAREWAERRRQQQEQQEQQQRPPVAGEVTQPEADTQHQVSPAEPSTAHSAEKPSSPVPVESSREQSSGPLKEQIQSKDTNSSSIQSQPDQVSDTASETVDGAGEAAVAASGVVSEARSIADQFLVMAEALAKKGDQVQAVRQLNMAIKRDPSHVEAHHRRAELSAAMGDTKAAVADLHHVLLHLDPSHVASTELLVQKAADVALAGSVKEALSMLAPVNLSLPTDEEFCVDLASALAQQGDYAGALEALQRISAGGAQSVEIERLRARLEVLAGKRADQQAAGNAEGGHSDVPHHPSQAGPASRHRPGRWVRHSGGGASSELAQGQESEATPGAEV